MSAARVLRDLGAVPELTPEGGLRLVGLSALGRETAVRVLDVARTRKAEILAELKVSAAASSAHAEMHRFFSTAVEHRFPGGARGWVDPAYLQSLEAASKRERARPRLRGVGL